MGNVPIVSNQQFAVMLLKVVDIPMKNVKLAAGDLAINLVEGTSRVKLVFN